MQCATGRLVLCLLVIPGSGAAAQVVDHTVTVSAKVDGKAYQLSGPGNCKHFGQNPDFPTWMAHYSGPEESSLRLDLTYGRNKGSADRLSLKLVTGDSSHEINSLIPGRGTGTVTLRPAGAGGRFEVKGKNAKGAPMEVAITCATFQQIEAEGG